ncbi:MFS transporter [Mesorhizobium sp. L-8-10]|uniref:MFS transporter n=1 Tax=unclassified Mesorhizobium TaxID=325217 RepID=UPI0019285AC7|nr:MULTISPECIES: MFS transporter [unclassified Mesorhizobium]BCH23807.1 MFS transporter [Mesorhizobium sp. L-8-3]BCH31537.1 MFS transporter [Mesorhizobium sp. L-8-10]
MDRRLVWLAVGSFAMSTVGFVFSSLLPAIARDAHISVPHAGYLITAFSLSYAVGAPVLSALAGAIDRRRVLAVTMLFFVAGNAGAALSSSFETLLAAQILMGMAAGLFAATAQATAVALAGPDHRARAIAVVVGGTTFAVALGAPAGSLIAALWGWRGAFLSIALLGFACAAILWMRLPHGVRGTSLTLRERLTAIGRPGILPSLLVTLLYLTGGFTIISYLAPLAIDGAGLPGLAMPAMLLAFGVGAVIGNMASGYVADRIGATRMVVLSLLMSTAICIVLALVLKLFPHDVSGPLLIALMVPWGIVGWAFPPAQASRIVGYAPDLAHLTLSLNASALYFGIALGTVVGGRILEYATPSDLGLVAAAFPLAALVMLWVSRPSPVAVAPAE